MKWLKETMNSHLNGWICSSVMKYEEDLAGDDFMGSIIKKGGQRLPFFAQSLTIHERIAIVRQWHQCFFNGRALVNARGSAHFQPCHRSGSASTTKRLLTNGCTRGFVVDIKFPAALTSRSVARLMAWRFEAQRRSRHIHCTVHQPLLVRNRCPRRCKSSELARRFPQPWFWTRICGHYYGWFNGIPAGLSAFPPARMHTELSDFKCSR